LAASAKLHPPYAETIRACQAKVLEFSEVAMSLSLAGNPTAAVQNLILHGTDTLSTRLIDNAYQVLQRHGSKIQGVPLLAEAIKELKAKTGGSITARASLGEQKRQAGALALRAGKRPAPEPAAPVALDKPPDISATNPFDRPKKPL
jgi:hypothetical protein